MRLDCKVAHHEDKEHNHHDQLEPEVALGFAELAQGLGVSCFLPPTSLLPKKIHEHKAVHEVEGDAYEKVNRICLLRLLMVLVAALHVLNGANVVVQLFAEVDQRDERIPHPEALQLLYLVFHAAP